MLDSGCSRGLVQTARAWPCRRGQRLSYRVQVIAPLGGRLSTVTREVLGTRVGVHVISTWAAADNRIEQLLGGMDQEHAIGDRKISAMFRSDRREYVPSGHRVACVQLGSRQAVSTTSVIDARSILEKAAHVKCGSPAH